MLIQKYLKKNFFNILKYKCRDYFLVRRLAEEDINMPIFSFLCFSFADVLKIGSNREVDSKDRRQCSVSDLLSLIK